MPRSRTGDRRDAPLACRRPTPERPAIRSGVPRCAAGGSAVASARFRSVVDAESLLEVGALLEQCDRVADELDHIHRAVVDSSLAWRVGWRADTHALDHASGQVRHGCRQQHLTRNHTPDRVVRRVASRHSRAPQAVPLALAGAADRLPGERRSRCPQWGRSARSVQRFERGKHGGVALDLRAEPRRVGFCFVKMMMPLGAAQRPLTTRPRPAGTSSGSMSLMTERRARAQREPNARRAPSLPDSIASASSVATAESVAVAGSVTTTGSVAVAGSVATVGSVGVVRSAVTAGSVAVAGSVATAGSVAVAGSAATAGSVAVAGSAATGGSLGILASALTILGVGLERCVGTVACVNCTRCVGCIACVDCVDCVGCVGCVGLRGAIGQRAVHA